MSHPSSGPISQACPQEIREQRETCHFTVQTQERVCVSKVCCFVFVCASMCMEAQQKVGLVICADRRECLPGFGVYSAAACDSVCFCAQRFPPNHSL